MCGIPALGTAYGPSNLTLKNKRGSGVLTGGSERPGLQRRRSAMRTHGESRAALGEGLLQGVSGLLDGTA